MDFVGLLLNVPPTPDSFFFRPHHISCYEVGAPTGFLGATGPVPLFCPSSYLLMEGGEEGGTAVQCLFIRLAAGVPNFYQNSVPSFPHTTWCRE